VIVRYLRDCGKSFPGMNRSLKLRASSVYDDLQIPGMVYGRILRSPMPKTDGVLQIDNRKQKRLPGVLGILLLQDVPKRLIQSGSGNPPSPDVDLKMRGTDHPLCGRDRIAAVAALTEEACAEAFDANDSEIRAPPGGFWG